MGDGEHTGALAGGDRAVEEPAERVLEGGRIVEYGRMAARAPTQVLTWAFRAIDEFEPEFVDRARAAWKDLLQELPRRNLMRNVTFEWLLRHPYGPMRTFDVQAWTNSPTEIYVGNPSPHIEDEPIDEDAWWRAVLYHEAVHVKQFAAAGAPDTYTRMMEYEVEAYGESLEWLSETKHPDRYRTGGMDEITERMANGHDLFESEMEMVNGSTSDIQDREDRHERREELYRRFLLGERWSGVPAFLPPHEDIEELYGR